jgi:predicted DNA-binding transcriptional regulator YafY
MAGILKCVTKPTARVLLLLEILQSGGTWRVRELAERLEVDERTVRRYAAHLTDLDVPVRSVRGRYGGYRLAPGFRLPPLMFTDDEAVAVLFGLVAARRTAPATVPAESSDSAIAKLRRVLPEPLARRLDALLAATEFTTPAAADADPGGIDGAAARSLLMFAGAAGARQPVALDYTDRHGRHSNRLVHPYGLVVHSGRWYVVAADPTDGEVRSLRLDRITAPTLRQGTFHVPKGFDPRRHLVENLANAPRAHAVSVRVHASPEHVRARISSSLALVEEADQPGWVRVRIHAERLEWIPALLAGLDCRFIVEEPAALRDRVRALARQLEQYAGQTVSSTRVNHRKSRAHIYDND